MIRSENADATGNIFQALDAHANASQTQHNAQGPDERPIHEISVAGQQRPQNKQWLHEEQCQSDKRQHQDCANHEFSGATMPAALIGLSFQPAFANTFLLFGGAWDLDEREFIEVNCGQREGYIQIVVVALHTQSDCLSGRLFAQP